MKPEEKLAEATDAPVDADRNAVAHGQTVSAASGNPASQIDQSKGSLPATIDGAVEDLLLREPRKYGVVAVLRMLAVWARSTHDTAERMAQLREENARLKEERRAEKKHRPVRIAIYLLVPILAGIGIDQIKSESFAVGIALLVAAAILLGVALYVSNRGSEGE